MRCSAAIVLLASAAQAFTPSGVVAPVSSPDPSSRGMMFLVRRTSSAARASGGNCGRSWLLEEAGLCPSRADLSHDVISPRFPRSATARHFKARLAMSSVHRRYRPLRRGGEALRPSVRSACEWYVIWQSNEVISLSLKPLIQQMRNTTMHSPCWTAT